ncbi:glycoside hydrolase family 28 protein [Phlebiopsis gigantea 11061_1 CR5-6]|uniref:galacturonan 1,4-alpha-galacturonidase n=1 Tax=Phlebiopsis gigantea (strain 11061_1 CR5-6) TaxID=745531 RepID=A0A0C3PAD3_PHLG1|nr:glycoside hydrolase family 28 protein [Phlebiopsis gigantea 11061_1 CR5-6]
MVAPPQRVAALLLASATLASGWNTFTVPHTDGQNDTPGLLSVLSAGNFTANSTILFKKGITYNIFTPIKFPTLNNVEVAIEGNLTYPADIPTVQAAVASSTYPGAWITFTGGTNVTFRGTTDPHWGWIDGHGQAWWDAVQQNNRPHGIAFSKINGGAIKNIKLWKPIGWNFATSGAANIKITGNKILAVSSTGSFPFNTDGFSAGGTNLTFSGNHIENGDDCLTVGNGAKNIHWTDSYCANGHGLSIGSLGSGGSVADVQNILIENTVMVNSLYGARFKSWTGGNGLARNITWRNIAFTNVPFPIYVTQNYYDQEDGAPPSDGTTNNTHIQDFLFQGFAGTIEDRPFVEGSCVSDPCWYAVPGATGKEVAILDLYPGTATNIVAKDVFAVTETLAPVRVMCNATTITSDVGFKCWDGLYIPTKAGF